MANVEDSSAVWAAEIEAAGWRQCSIFRPPTDESNALPDYLGVGSGEWLVICTQSCSVCSENFANEPLVELLVASPLATFNARHGDAQGKNNHTFHLPVGGLLGVAALSCQLGRRAFVPRRLLRGWKPENTWLEQAALNAFKGWLANYYMRVALPGRLVERLRAPGGIKETVKTALENRVGGRKVADGVASFYIRWNTDEELPEDRYYSISLVAVCTDEETLQSLDRNLSALKGTRSSPLTINDILVEELIVDTTDNLTLAALGGMSRFNEWDDMSPMPDRLTSMKAAV